MKSNLANNLKYLRLIRGGTQGGVAKKIGIIQKSLNEYENGKGLPSLSTLMKIADYYELSLTEIVEEDLTKIIPNPFEF